MKVFRTLLADREAVSVMEFALVLPLFLLLGMGGAEVAWMTVVKMENSQIALSLADNASRLGQTDNSGVTPTIAQADVDSVLDGAVQQGASIGLAANGRAILSSLEVDSATGKQYIHWQRCRGRLRKASLHGDDGARNGLASGEISGVGTAGHLVTAKPGSAIMVAEVWNTYQPLFGTMFSAPRTMYDTAVIIIRDDRNLTPGLTGVTSRSTC